MDEQALVNAPETDYTNAEHLHFLTFDSSS